MESIFFYLAVTTFLFFIILGIELVRGQNGLKFLKDFPVSGNAVDSKVSVIVPARNEERNIEEALQSLVRQDYENLEIIIVDDRSTDSTGKIIDRMVKSNPRLKTLHITELPRGWLGKNYALYTGSEHATGDYLLFTDADVVMEPSIISRAVRYMRENKVDHLALGPEAKMEGVMLNIFMGAFAIFFGLYAMPWRAGNPKSKKHIGIGAFNMVRRDVYQTIGTHQAIAMRPDDDLKLGKLVKKHGYQQSFLFGKDLIHVEWYSSFLQLLRGLEKNSFAGLEYSMLALVLATLFQLILFVWPFLGVLLTGGWAQILNLLIVILLLSLCYYSAGFHNQKKIYIFGFPIGVLMFVFILWRSTLLTLWHDGIDWRDTHYSLTELKANKV